MALLLAGCMLITVGCIAISRNDTVLTSTDEPTAEPAEQKRAIDGIADAYEEKVSECEKLLKSVAETYLNGKEPDRDTMNALETLDGEIDEKYAALRHDPDYGGDELEALQKQYKKYYQAVLESDHTAESYEVMTGFADVMLLGELSNYSRLLVHVSLQRTKKDN